MPDFNKQTLLGMFAMVTLLLALTVVGRLLGLHLWPALYLAGLLVVAIGAAAYRRGAK